MLFTVFVYRTHLCIEPEENISSVSVQTGDPHSEVRLILLKLFAIRSNSYVGRNETRFRLPVDLGLLPI